jgi:tRNA(fMet)-specific endonuclease VapC
MIAYDTDVLTDLLYGKPDVVARAAAVPVAEQMVPVVVAEEILRGRLDLVRRAEAGKARMTLEAAYELLRQAFLDLRQMNILPYTADADTHFSLWRGQKLKVKTHDLRIAAIAFAHGATLVSRNRRDYELVPGLALELWV